MLTNYFVFYLNRSTCQSIYGLLYAVTTAMHHNQYVAGIMRIIMATIIVDTEGGLDQSLIIQTLYHAPYRICVHADIPEQEINEIEHNDYQ